MVQKQCSTCGEWKPLENFKDKRNQCKSCEAKYYQRYKTAKSILTVKENRKMLVQRKYKEIIPERILDINKHGILSIGTDEIFVKCMDYDQFWISNYGRAIHCAYGRYNLLNGSTDKYGKLFYTAKKDIYINGSVVQKPVHLLADRAVVDNFIVNPDAENYVMIWHAGNDIEDNYYQNLYPLCREQYKAIKAHFKITGDDSEELIVSVMNDILYKPDTWRAKDYEVTVAGHGYHGCSDCDTRSKSYQSWKNMMFRAYGECIHKYAPYYIGASVCEEWLSYANFRKWYDEHYYMMDEQQMNLDKDILWKGNKVYSPETCCFVPKFINILFIANDKVRGDNPIGVWYEDGRYRAGISYFGKYVKIGDFDTKEAAFERYKEKKEKLLQDVAIKYKEQIPYRLYEAMMRWKVEIDD